MGFDTSPDLAVREKAQGRAGTVSCPKCGGTNTKSATRCRSCLALLSRSTPREAAPRSAAPVVYSRSDVDALFGELEALTRKGDPSGALFQCPSCEDFVKQDATRCRCGAIFEDSRDIVGYECPICGARVSSDATRCRCGARFA